MEIKELEEFSKIIKGAKKERITKREIHREKKRLGTLEEELDKIDQGREFSDKIAARYIGNKKG